MARYAIFTIEGNRQKLDGGAMFGNVPHPLWSQWIAPDERLRIPLACRAFLVHDLARDRRVLLESGVGCFFEPKLMDRFGVEETDHRLLANLAARGVSPEQVDDVVLSHLHFDHAGGLLTPWRADGGAELVFPRARFWVGRGAWRRATAPHPRDRASFLPQLHRLLEDSGRLQIVDGHDLGNLGEGFSCTLSDGHTPGMLLTRLQADAGTIAFCGDLIPGQPWVHLPVAMGYDRYPELLIDEKRAFLERACAERELLLFTHDPVAAAARVVLDDNGRYRPIDPLAALDNWRL